MVTSARGGRCKNTKGKRMMKLRILLSALLLATGLAFIAGCGENSPENTGEKAPAEQKPAEPKPAATAKKPAPEDVVGAFWQAVFVGGDAETATNLCSFSGQTPEQAKQGLSRYIRRFADRKKDPEYAVYAKMISNAKIGSVTVEGDTANVSMIYTVEKESRFTPGAKKGDKREDKKALQLKRIDGNWRIVGFRVDL